MQHGTSLWGLWALCRDLRDAQEMSTLFIGNRRAARQRHPWGICPRPAPAERPAPPRLPARPPAALTFQGGLLQDLHGVQLSYVRARDLPHQEHLRRERRATETAGAPRFAPCLTAQGAPRGLTKLR